MRKLLFGVIGAVEGRAKYIEGEGDRRRGREGEVGGEV